MHPATATERFVSNNPTMHQSRLGPLVPQQVTGISREGSPVEFEWGDGVTRVRTLHSDRSAHNPMRVIYHPGLNQSIHYPKNPDRTINYWRGPVRKLDTQATRTVGGMVRSRGTQKWEDVVITEVWEGGGGRASITVDFLQTLYSFMVEDVPLGSYVGWIPRDLSFNRHLIVPLTLTVGSQDFDLRAVRAKIDIGDPREMVVDQQVAFTFGLAKPQIFVPSIMTSEGV